MTVTNSLLDGARLALTLGITLALVNGVFMRFSPSHRTLDRIVSDMIGMGNGGTA